MNRSNVPTITAEYFRMVQTLYKSGNINIDAKNELLEYGCKLLSYLDLTVKDEPVDLAPVMRRLAARSRR